MTSATLKHSPINNDRSHFIYIHPLRFGAKLLPHFSLNNTITTIFMTKLTRQTAAAVAAWQALAYTTHPAAPMAPVQQRTKSPPPPPRCRRRRPCEYIDLDTPCGVWVILGYPTGFPADMQAYMRHVYLLGCHHNISPCLLLLVCVSASPPI